MENKTNNNNQKPYDNYTFSSQNVSLCEIFKYVQWESQNKHYLFRK